MEQDMKGHVRSRRTNLSESSHSFQSGTHAPSFITQFPLSPYKDIESNLFSEQYFFNSEFYNSK